MGRDSVINRPFAKISSHTAQQSRGGISHALLCLAGGQRVLKQGFCPCIVLFGVLVSKRCVGKVRFLQMVYYLTSFCWYVIHCAICYYSAIYEYVCSRFLEIADSSSTLECAGSPANLSSALPAYLFATLSLHCLCPRGPLSPLPHQEAVLTLPFLLLSCTACQFICYVIFLTHLLSHLNLPFFTTQPMPVFQNSSFMTVGASSTAPFAISSIMCSCNAVHGFVCKVLCCLWHMVHRFTLRFLKESCTGEAFSGFRVVPSSLLQPLENCPRCHCPRSSSPGSRKTRTHFVRHSTSIRSP